MIVVTSVDASVDAGVQGAKYVYVAWQYTVNSLKIMIHSRKWCGAFWAFLDQILKKNHLLKWMMKEDSKGNFTETFENFGLK